MTDSMKFDFQRTWAAGATGVGRVGVSCVLGAAMTLGLAGCKAKPAADDGTLTTTIQNQLAADGALGGQQVSVNVQNGVASLSGMVSNDAQRTIAARDAAGVAGVKEVINSLTVGAISAGVTTPLAAPVPLKPAAGLSAVESRRELERDRSRGQDQGRDERRDGRGAPIDRVPAQQQGYNQAPAPPVQQQQAAPPPQQPVFRNMTIAAGDSVPVRVTQTLDSATTQQGQTFSGVVASDVVSDGVIVLHAGDPVTGQVDEVHEAAHFKGAALLTVSLNSINRHGERIALNTEPYTVEGKGRGKNTLEKTGIGAAGGAILGGIFGGGKGAAIGAAAGGGAGAGVNGITRGQQVQIPSETVVRFRLNGPVTLRVRTDGGDRRNSGDANLPQRRPY